MNHLRAITLALGLALASAGQVAAQEQLHCPECERAYPAQPKYCTKDGTKLEERVYDVKGCPRCQRSFDKGEKYCPWDGNELKQTRPAERACQKCGRVYSGGEVFCSKDGAPLGGEVLRPAPAKAPAEPEPAGPLKPEPVGPKPPKTTILKAPPSPPPGEVRRSVDMSFTASSNSTGFLPFSLSRPGVIEVTAEFVGEGPAVVVLHAPGQIKPVAKKEGPSPIVLRYQVSNAAISLGRDFEVWVVRNSKAPARGELTVSMPFDPRDVKREKRAAPARPKGQKPEGKDDGEGELIKFKLGKTFYHPFEANKLGRYELEVNYPGKAEVAVFVIDAITRKKLATKSGRSPLKLSFQATPKTRKLALIISDFSYQDGQPKTEGAARLVRP